MSIKISFMHYRNYITLTRVKSAVAFKEFDMVYLFWLLFQSILFQLLSICKGSTLAKIWGGRLQPPSLISCYGPVFVSQYILIFFFMFELVKLISKDSLCFIYFNVIINQRLKKISSQLNFLFSRADEVKHVVLCHN